MGIFNAIIKDLTKPRPKFRKGDKVEHKLNNKTYIIIDLKEEPVGNFIYLCSDGKNKEQFEQEMIQKHYEPISGNF